MLFHDLDLIHVKEWRVYMLSSIYSLLQFKSTVKNWGQEGNSVKRQDTWKHGWAGWSLVSIPLLGVCGGVTGYGQTSSAP